MAKAANGEADSLVAPLASEVHVTRCSRTAYITAATLGAAAVVASAAALGGVLRRGALETFNPSALGQVAPDTFPSMVASMGELPVVYVAETVRPDDDASFGRFKSNFLDAVDAPSFAERLEPIRGVNANDLPVKIELLEEAAAPLRDGLASVTGAYEGKKHAYANGKGGHALFLLDEGKKLVVSREELKSTAPGLYHYLEDIQKQTGYTGNGGELSEPEKRALGVRVGSSMSHLMAWTRARKAGAKLGFVLESSFDAAGRGKTFATSAADEDEGEGTLVSPKDLNAMLDAVAAYHPADADVVFLDRMTDPSTSKGESVMRLTKPQSWSSDVKFLPAKGNEGGSGFYLFTASFLEKVYPLIDDVGLQVVDEWLVSQCATHKTLRCYQTTPGFGRSATKEAVAEAALAATSSVAAVGTEKGGTDATAGKAVLDLIPASTQSQPDKAEEPKQPEVGQAREQDNELANPVDEQQEETQVKQETEIPHQGEVQQATEQETGQDDNAAVTMEDLFKDAEESVEEDIEETSNTDVLKAFGEEQQEEKEVVRATTEIADTTNEDVGRVEDVTQEDLFADFEDDDTVAEKDPAKLGQSGGDTLHVDGDVKKSAEDSSEHQSGGAKQDNRAIESERRNDIDQGGSEVDDAAAAFERELEIVMAGLGEGQLDFQLPPY